MIHLFLSDFFIYLFLATWGSAGIYPGSGLSQEMECAECHSELVENEVSHYPVQDACDNCHESTGEEHPGDSLGFTLMDQIPELCLSCHSKSYETDSSTTNNIGRLVKGKMLAHSAIEGGGCSVCHKSHGSEYQNLLVDLYPEDDYSEASTAEFGLCFLCHDTDLLEAEETEWGTNFRNGNQNLHWLHTNGSKGRNCRMCHNLHGSEQKFLIEEEVRFGNWEMSLNFIPEEQGGSCLTGCHGKLSYSRE